jgi:hypothetical protein
LDHALSLDDKERAIWLTSLEEQNPEIAHLVRTLLQEHSVLSGEIGWLSDSARSL